MPTNLIRSSRIFLHLGWRDLRIQYGRSRLGPLWSVATLSVSVFGVVLAQGILIGRVDFASVAPEISVALWIWLFFSAVVNESTLLFENERRSLLNSLISENVFLAKLIWKHLLSFGLSTPVIVAIISISNSGKLTGLLTVFPMVLALAISLLFPVLLLARFCIVFPDLRGIVAPSVQLLFFFSPIIWRPNSDIFLSRLVVEMNPLAWIILTCQDAVAGPLTSATYLPRSVLLGVLVTAAFLIISPRLPSIKNKL